MKTREEFKALLKAAADPTTSAEALVGIHDAAVELFDTIEAGNTKIGELTTDNTKLRDTNMRLFLRVTGEAAKEEEPEKDIVAEVEAKIFENLGGKNNG